MPEELKTIVTPDGNAATPPPSQESEAFDTYYDSEGGSSSWGRPTQSLNEFTGRVRDGILKLVPADVTQHLVNSQKELWKAGIALAEARIRRADDVARRARDLHEKPQPEI